MDRHPSAQDLADLVAGRLSSSRQDVVRHLLAGCASCRDRIDSFDRGSPAFPRPRSAWSRTSPPDPEAFDYSVAFAAADRTLAYFLSDGRAVDEAPSVILAELGRPSEEIEHPPPPTTAERRALPFFIRWLVKKSFSYRYSSPGEMLHWALMSRIAAENCSAEVAGSAAKLADLRASAEAQLANALRVVGRSEEAEAIMGSAWEQLFRGSGDAELRATLLQKAASLFILQGRLDKALDSLREAAEILDDLGMRHEVARTEIMRAVAYHETGEIDLETHLLERASPLLDPREDVYLPMVVCCNLVHVYTEQGKQGRALAVLFEARNSGWHQGMQESVLLRLNWNEGKLLSSLGMPDPAERTLSRARAGFLRQGLLYDLVAVTQDLVHVQRELGRWDAAERSIAATNAQVRARRSGPEVLRVLDQLQASSA